jgi:hypothetical protein
VKRVLISVLCLTGVVLSTSLVPSQAATKAVPAKLTAKATPKTDLKAPYRFKLSGAMTPPATRPKKCAAGVTSGPYCSPAPIADICVGTVRITIKRGPKTLARKGLVLKLNCTYSAKITMRKAMKHGKLTVTTRFLGNALLGPRSAKALKLRV